MILDFKLQTSADTMRISAPLVDMDIELHNLAGVRRNNAQIVSIGETADEMKAKAPEYWERNAADIKFVRPFGPPAEGSGKFEPLLAARILHYYATKAFSALKRQSAKRAILGPWVDRVSYDLEIEGFQQLPLADRRQFLKDLKKSLPAIQRIQINGETVFAK